MSSPSSLSTRTPAILLGWRTYALPAAELAVADVANGEGCP
jgi:hypothetical protein